jgi:hypothetical protein
MAACILESFFDYLLDSMIKALLSDVVRRNIKTDVKLASVHRIVDGL